jgi:dUTP pyrophosphatase
MWALEYFCHYIHGKKVVIRTDHQAVQYIFAKGSVRPVPRKFARWIVQLGEYDYTITYKQGRANTNADALSRPPFVDNITTDSLIVIGDHEPIKVRRLAANAIIPGRSTEEAAGYDLHALHDVSIAPTDIVQVNTGIAIQMPRGVYGRIAPRSGLAAKFGIDVMAGVIDSDYCGPLIVLLVNMGKRTVNFRAGDRIAQLILEQYLTPPVVGSDELNITKRDQAGLGSTGVAQQQ